MIKSRRGRRQTLRWRLPGWTWLVVAAATCLLTAAPLLAGGSEHEKPYALIFGTVWAPDQRPAPGIRVKIQRAGEKKPRWELTSDARGEFAQRVPPEPAEYLVWAERKGSKEPAAETKVHIEADERVDVGLHLTE
jgi:hypothetical protein